MRSKRMILTLDVDTHALLMKMSDYSGCPAATLVVGYLRYLRPELERNVQEMERLKKASMQYKFPFMN